MSSGGAPTLVVADGADLAAALSALPDGAVVGLRAGRYTGGLHPRRSVTLRGLDGAGRVILDGDDESRVLTVDTRDIRVVVEGVTLRGGRANAGGAVALKAVSHVHLDQCILTQNESYQVGGGAAFAHLGELSLTRCRIHANEAPRGVAVQLDGVAGLALDQCLVVGGEEATGGLLLCTDGARVAIERCTLVAPAGPCAVLRGTTSRAPVFTAARSILAGAPALRNHELLPARVEVCESVLSTAPAGAWEDGGGNRVADPAFAGTGPEPYRPLATSPAAGWVTGGGEDLSGAPRSPQTAAGALEAGR